MANRWRDWYEQGKRDYERALLDFRYGYYEWACFTCQQAAEKAIKAPGMVKGLTLWGHSLTEMLKKIQEILFVPEELVDLGRLLDFYYIPARYPNGFASGKPADYFTKSQAQEALGAADRIIRFCESHLPQS
ncbi:HEPN domain-containing protein [Thermodesulforhabdus norvegica]|uniref:HEPN domain-containing protein n=1 Tax=Thermodesulforhabdus norvegica TaxID=39841 RepID=A0A1I4TNK7_9BACT|nr:HEPN domain-containing protein [Thermodesulforhabdus norvegica]SFM78299.1 HEPN domain-containing protein [Thermodesulforhabdus norvegica]